MADFWKAVDVFVKNLTILMWPIFLICLVLIFAPLSLASRLGYEKIVDDYRMWIGLTLVVTICFILVDITKRINVKVKASSELREVKSSVKKKLLNLSPQQKLIVSDLANPEKPSGMILDIANGDVKDLVRKKIIVTTGNIGRMSGFPHSLSNIAEEILSKNQSILDKINENDSIRR